MEYQYYDMFNLEEELVNAISTIISAKEGEKLEFKMIDVCTSKTIELVFNSPLDGYNPWGGGLNAPSGAQIAAYNEKYGTYEFETIPARYYHFLVVATDEELNFIKKVSFSDLTSIEKTLKSVFRVSSEYDDVSFNPNILTQKFPYLESFFDSLNEWRVKTRRVTIDNDIIEQCKNSVLEDISKKLSK